MHSSSEPAVIVQDLGVTYPPRRPPQTRAVTGRHRPGRAPRRLTSALDGVSFEVPAGRVVGIVGRNGAGKTTLLRTIAGIIPPTRGQVVVRGHVQTVLNLGIGFNGDLTGRQNGIVGCIAAGHHRAEAERLLPDIVSFAELEHVIDDPIRTYSAGMRGRLAFATAMILDPDVLLIDEALAVGDLSFRQRCAEAIRTLSAGRSTVLIASHSVHLLLDLCDMMIWVDEGAVRALGPPVDVAAAYRSAFHPGSGHEALVDNA